MRLPFTMWPGHCLSLPSGLELSRNATLATTRKVPEHSRRARARRLVDHGAAALPTRAIRVATAGGYATQTFWRTLPSHVDVVGRCFRTAPLSQLPPPRVKGQRGAPRKKGDGIGAPNPLATPSAAWPPPPQEAEACIQSGVGIGQSVFPGRPIRVVVVWRPHRADRTTPTGHKALGRLTPLEALFSTAVRLAVPALLETYEDRWAIAIALRDGHAYDGLAQDQCRKYAHMVGANTLRFLLAAARTLCFIGTSEPQADVALQRFRPWSRHKVAPSQFDVAWACREGLQEAGIFPIPRIFTAVAENQQELDKSERIAA